MASKPVSEYTDEELQRAVKSTTTVYIGLISIYVVMLIIMLVYAWMRNWDFEMKTPLIVVFIGGFVTTLPMLTVRSKFASELKKRQSGDAA